MDLPVVEKPVPAISMNCDNQTVMIKVNSSKDNLKTTRQDQFTKGLSRNVIDSGSVEMGLRPT